MLNATIKPHRPYLRADAGVQKLFVMVKLLPAPEAGRGRPRVDLALVIDTSGSMRDGTGAQGQITRTTPFTMDGNNYNATFEGASKLDVAIEAARRLFESTHLAADDTVSLIQFDDRSEVVAAGKASADQASLLAAADRLAQYSGGTQMAPGLCNAEAQLRKQPGGSASRTVLLLTDGLAIDEEESRRAASALAALGARVVALGVGEEYNEDLLADICSTTQGKPYDFRDMTALPTIFETELGAATRQVVAESS